MAIGTLAVGHAGAVTARSRPHTPVNTGTTLTGPVMDRGRFTDWTMGKPQW